MTDETNGSALDQSIVSARIHPAIGIARVGNAQCAFYIGPEVISPPPATAGDRRDGAGALKREAARFRIYGYDQAGHVVREITASDAQIEWQVELANLKANWYQFQIALDIPEAASALPSEKRNAGFADRSKLGIETGLCVIAGAARDGAEAVLCEGQFNGQPVYLGELQTDPAGRLIVLGGRGKTGSLPGAKITTFANNDGWHDDTSDGPVSATLTMEGRSIPVDPAWVVVAPPNYAPDLKGIRTLYDLVRDVFIDTGALPPPAMVSFANDVLPIFERLAALQWVNAGYGTMFGAGGTLDLQSPALMTKLSDANESNKSFRFEIFNSFRDYDKDSWSPLPWPWLYGDGMDLPFAKTPRQNVMLAKHQLLCLSRWADGDFTSDYPAGRQAYVGIDSVPLAEQPAMLDRAALDFCLADAFHPGCELTWPIRHASLYMAPFRIRHRRISEALPDTGDVLSPASALATDGPLYGQRAGWLTRWMAVPWHADAASCRSQASYDPTYNPFVPTFWPARVPNQVLTEHDYAIVIDGTRPRDEQVGAFRSRIDWIDATLGKLDYRIQIASMLSQYGAMGLIEARQGVAGDPDIPPVIYVSDGTPAPQMLGAALVAPPHVGVADDFVERIGQFPHGARR